MSEEIKPPIMYVVKRILFNGRKASVALQNTNGPCPLLAVANILSLRGHFSIHDDKSVVTADELLAAVSDYLFDANSVADSLQKNHESNVNDVIQMLPNTLVGIDVNLKFDTITSFEFNSDIILFDFCNVRLVHGWLVDPQDATYSFIRKLSYNQLVEKELEHITNAGLRSPPRSKLHVVGSSSPALSLAKLNLNDGESKHTTTESEANTSNTTTTTTTTTTTDSNPTTNVSALPPDSPKTSNTKSEKATEALLAEQFLNETATQLTYHGLAELHSGLKDEELCVFFRNNHFNTLYKHNGELYVLVTDQGYANEPLVWEKLCQIDGDSTFVRSDFTTYQATSPFMGLTEEAAPRQSHEDEDLALALQLQDEENKKPVPEEPKKHKKDKEKEKEHCILQ